MNRERFEELAKLKGMDLQIQEIELSHPAIKSIVIREYMSRMTEAAWFGWQWAMKESYSGNQH